MNTTNLNRRNEKRNYQIGDKRGRIVKGSLSQEKVASTWGKALISSPFGLSTFQVFKRLCLSDRMSKRIQYDKDSKAYMLFVNFLSSFCFIFCPRCKRGLLFRDEQHLLRSLNRTRWLYQLFTNNNQHREYRRICLLPSWAACCNRGEWYSFIYPGHQQLLGT